MVKDDRDRINSLIPSLLALLIHNTNYYNLDLKSDLHIVLHSILTKLQLLPSFFFFSIKYKSNNFPFGNYEVDLPKDFDHTWSL